MGFLYIYLYTMHVLPYMHYKSRTSGRFAPFRIPKAQVFTGDTMIIPFNMFLLCICENTHKVWHTNL